MFASPKLVVKKGAILEHNSKIETACARLHMVLASNQLILQIDQKRQLDGIFAQITQLEKVVIGIPHLLATAKLDVPEAVKDRCLSFERLSTSRLIKTDQTSEFVYYGFWGRAQRIKTSFKRLIAFPGSEGEAEIDWESESYILEPSFVAKLWEYNWTQRCDHIQRSLSTYYILPDDGHKILD
ncbi:MAG: hypothetical protein MMC23_007610 [Stictis urceolatum]|nr:hypothetical protein [Stictis urceolata]